MPSKKIRLLIVDDEKDICRFVKLLFRKKGFLAYSALSGNQALKVIKRVRPEIILLDIHLKRGIDGLEVLKRAKKFLSDCRYVMVTWDKAQAKMKEAKRLGAISYLTKPLTTNRLLNVVNRLVKTIEREGS